MVVDYCYGCGIDITQDKTRRRLNTTKSKLVLTCWKAFVTKLNADTSTISLSGFICRSCFSTYERYISIQNKLENNIGKFLDKVVVPHSSPKRMRIESASVPVLLSQPSASSSPDVGVHVTYKKPKTYVLTPRRKVIGKAVARGSKMAVAKECLKDPITNKHIMNIVGNKMRKEMKAMVSDNVNSVMRSQGIDELKSFNWDILIQELTIHAPTLLNILISITKTITPRENQKAIIGICATILLKQRYSKMSLVQKIISIILYAGHASKQVYARLQRLNLCMSHKTVIRLIGNLGMNHDAKVKEWQKSLSQSLIIEPGGGVHLDAILTLPSREEVESSCSSASSDDEFSDFSPPPFSPIMSDESFSLDSDSESEDNTSLLTEKMDEILSVAPEMQTDQQSETTTYSVVGDNLDKSIKPRYNRLQSQGIQLLHYFHHIAIADRIDVSNLSLTPPMPPKIAHEQCARSLLPSTEDDRTLKDNMIILISRILVTNIESFKFNFSDVTVWHIETAYQEEMSMESEVVPLGIILKNENKNSEMVEIMTQIHDYVPKLADSEQYTDEDTSEIVNIPNDKLHPILLGGDQLTVARARGAKKAKINSVDPSLHLDGLIPVAEDWHTRLNFIEVIWRYFVSTESSGDHGTLYQLRNCLGRTSVGRHPEKNFNGCDDFFSTVISGHVLSALGELEIDFDPSSMWMETKEERKQMLLSIAAKIVDKFVDFSYHRGDPDSSSDNVHKYAIQIISLGLFYTEFSDSIKEGDGNRILRCWRYLLPIFWNAGRTNYSNEVLSMLYQHDYGLSPRHAAQLMWTRCVNVHGRKGKNIPADLHLEHLNRVVKDSIKGLGSNKTERAITRVSKALGTIVPVLDNFDSNNNIPDTLSDHSKPNSEKDVNLIVNELSKAKVFKTIPSRNHNKFPHPRNVLHGREKKDLEDWMINKLKKLYKL